MVKSKYQDVLVLASKLYMRELDVQEENGKLKLSGTVKNQYEKNQLWDAIKRAGGENPSDIVADIKVSDTSALAHHTVKSGESLSKIAKQYYGDAGKYNKIYEANKDKLKSADLIHPGDELVIPNL
ncbi:LysM peptidoglycan-binding domain-containing protein [Aequorivita sp. H23M31]|uniref:LysM peptidoglycan-binding domain-containing protein n=1 Tax=Aequorivita ciconiae TaxID=2494375 RepID=A0A410G2I4_9FLAO|nr:LysM peptidoglycan-binding domain-containing protein [Aequorivita sp. H23M31]QAA81488.1 LysM peptidoglycan-binding domain-containing protein [Aequorivita sp. H23M31]